MASFEDVERGDRQAAARARANVTYHGGLSALEDVLFQRSGEPLSGEEQRALRLTSIAEAFARHVDACPPFAAYCEAMGVLPDAIATYDDLARIPLLPASLFKKRDVLSVPRERIAKTCVSSGTQGGKSRVHRDETTLERLLGSVRHGVALLDDRSLERERHVFVLGPDTDEADDLWFSYVLSLVDFLHPTTFYVRGGRFDGARALADLAALPARIQPVIIGPPFLVQELARAEGERALLGWRDGLVVTAGGWKRFAGDAPSRSAFDAAVGARFALEPRAIRDSYNAVELASVVFECEHREKHVPPWMFASARDPATMKPVSRGAQGLLAFCDPLATSYPCFVLTDDVGAVTAPRACRCGRFGETLSIVRRVTGIEARGCALKMDRALGPAARGAR